MIQGLIGLILIICIWKKAGSEGEPIPEVAPFAVIFITIRMTEETLLGTHP